METPTLSKLSQKFNKETYYHHIWFVICLDNVFRTSVEKRQEADDILMKLW